MSKTRRVLESLQANNLIDVEIASLEKVTQTYSVAVTEHIMQVMKASPTEFGLTAQFIPTEQELTVTQQERTDPIGDNAHSPVKGIVHRYPDRCLLKPVQVCPVYCRFCFRRESVGPGNAALTPVELQQCFAYIKNNQQIWEVIITGGDPLILKAVQLKKNCCCIIIH